jgi:hypothetical protein
MFKLNEGTKRRKKLANIFAIRNHNARPTKLYFHVDQQHLLRQAYGLQSLPKYCILGVIDIILI